MGGGIVHLHGLSKQYKCSREFALEVAKTATEVVPERVIGIDFKGLLQGVFSVVGTVGLIEKLSLPAPNFRIPRMLLACFIHDAQRRFVLTFRLLLKRLVDLRVDGLTAPLEFLAAAARARRVGIKCHGVPRDCASLSASAQGISCKGT